MQETFIIDGIRTAIGSFRGGLSSVRTDDLAAHVIRALLNRHEQLDPAVIDDVIMGCANQAGEDNRNIARMALLLAEVPWSVPGETVNRLCASGMSAVIHAHRAIQAGDGDIFVSGGVENMTRGPWVISKSDQPFGANVEMHDSSFGWRFKNPLMDTMYGTESMGETAENLATMYKISREDQDRYAYNSQRKAVAAKSVFKEEITPVMIPRKKQEVHVFDKDEFMKPQTTLEGLAALRPAFRESGTVTAGNSSGLNDGAAALLMASDFGVRHNGLKPMAKIVASAVVGVEPRIMGIGPVTATQLALKKAGLTLDKMDVIEINEAFAAQVLACTRALGLEDEDLRVNKYGGAIAMGHPLGMSGARIILSAARTLQRLDKKYALATMCVGVGQGYAVILEKM
ncbi:MAG TPA: acetyl-CoA C-acyltransferase [Saprospiraceae bacterium]|nr:acetyl-CoA C-acyltransferase [Saprospiraceae bacterium]